MKQKMKVMITTMQKGSCVFCVIIPRFFFFLFLGVQVYCVYCMYFYNVVNYKYAFECMCYMYFFMQCLFVCTFTMRQEVDMGCLQYGMALTLPLFSEMETH